MFPPLRHFCTAVALFCSFAPLPALAEDPVEAATVASLEDWVAFLRLPNVTKQSIVLKKSVSIGPNSDSLFL